MEQTESTRGCTALYLRLSKEDGGGESASIENQRKLLYRYVREKGLPPPREYLDNGCSGVTLNRPGLQRLLADIRAGTVAVVLTKDLSRLGRNSGRVSLLLDEFFPAHRVRYISVVEGIDTDCRRAVDTILTPIQNLANELYAADISGKIRSALNAKRQAGEFVGSFAPYGYAKSPENKNRLILDPATAPVVARIFGQAAAGRRPGEIAAALNRAGIPTPSQYRLLTHPHLREGSRPAAAQWSGSQVGKLLRNPVYLGRTVQGRTEKASFKSRVVLSKPRSAWICVEGAHPALVTKAQWEQVRRRLASRRPNRQEGPGNPFSGLVRCGDCGRAMSLVPARRPGGAAHLVCGGYKQSGRRACTSHRVSVAWLTQAVREAWKDAPAAEGLIPGLRAQFREIRIREARPPEGERKLTLELLPWEPAPSSPTPSRPSPCAWDLDAMR